MQSVTVGPIDCQFHPPFARVVADVSIGGAEFDLYFDVDGAAVRPSVESFLALALLPAMTLGLNVDLPGSVSARLVDQLPTIQSIFRIWGCDRYHHSRAAFTPVALSPTDVAPLHGPPASGVATFFSGGVDSFYTLLQHLAEITHVIYIRGFELPYNDRNCALEDTIARTVKTVAEEYGKSIVEVSTNARWMSDQYVSEQMNHGALLAAVAHLLTRSFGKVYIPSTHDYSQLFPWGSHPLLDPLWSTEAMTIVHDGCDASRLEKTASIASHPTALRHLRVCWNQEYNCGACNKCVRTIITLQALGMFERCSTFRRRPFTPAEIARLPPISENNACYFEEIIHFLDHGGGDKALASALRDALSMKYYRGLGRVTRGGLRERLNGRIKRLLDGVARHPALGAAGK